MNKSRENLRKYYVNQYGLDIANKIRRCECLKIKHARLVTSLNFLKRCRDKNIVPVCVKITPKTGISGSASILRQASLKLLRRLIRQNRYNLDHANKEIEAQSSELQVILSTDDFLIHNEIVSKRAQVKYEQFKNRQIQKFNKLVSNQNKHLGTSSINKPVLNCETIETRNADTEVSLSSVVNLSKQSLDKTTVSVLTKGLNYATTPRKIPYEEIICNVEECLLKNQFVKEDAEAIRQDISSALRRSRLPKHNLSRDEYFALKNLRNNEDLIILRADKGNATVVMDTSDYYTKIQDLLSDERTYKRVKSDPTDKILKQTIAIMKKHSEKLNLDVSALTPSCAKAPKLYGLPKIHKVNAPLRPIVSQIDTPTYKLAKHLAKVLSNLRGNTQSNVKDSAHLIDSIKNLELTDDEVLVSFDVESLFTSLPVKECIEIVQRKLISNDMPIEYAELLEHCLTTGYLVWDFAFYVQLDGIAMGSPVSPVVADIFMEALEEKALSTAPAVPKIYKRYVDDTFAVLPSNKVTAFLDHLNSINNNIQFTMELEANSKLAFLDVLILKNPDNTLGHTVYRKPTHTDKYLNGASHHHPSQLATVGKSLFQRAHTICDAAHLNGELQHVKQVLQCNQLKIPRQRHKRPKPPTVERCPAVLPYIKGITDKIGHILRRASIKTYYKPHRKINQFLRPVKCNIPLQDAGVYKLDCECGLSYIGQTKRSVKTRVKEHIADMKHGRSTKSAICEHTLDKPNHYMRFDKPQILAKENRFIPRMLREAIEIRKYPNFNREDGWQVPQVWDPIIKTIKSQTQRTTATRPSDTVSAFCVSRNTP